MKPVLRIGLGIALAVILVAVGLVGGWALWGRQLWAMGPYGAPGMGTWTGPGGWMQEDCGDWGRGMGPGMMGRGTASAAPCDAPGYGPGGAGGWTTEPSSDATALTIEEAHEAVEEYVAKLGYTGLEVSEVMEFERNFYAIVAESDTGIGAMELLIDKWTGTVGPEMGPNGMWNARYGMHGRGRGMMGWAVSQNETGETNTIPPEEASEIAQRWLDAHRPGVTVEEHTDPFYGYYTIHTLNDGEIEGMLSVHGTTGQVWYHTWHGAFVQMIGEEEEH
jgi:hypothetical protein